jgi:hypothetical protein
MILIIDGSSSQGLAGGIAALRQAGADEASPGGAAVSL